jgi:hypothetical protein
MRSCLPALAALGCVLILCADSARAQLECTEPLFQAGVVRSGTGLSHRFILLNRGEGKVTIEGVKRGCGCVRAAADRLTLEPGEEAGCVVEVNTVTQAEGPNTWRALLEYREGEKVRELPLFMTAQLVAEVTLSPATLVIQTETAIGHEFLMTERHEQPLTIVGVETASPHLRSKAGEPRRDAGGNWVRRISLEVLPSCPEGRYEDVLEIHTTDPQFQELKVPLVVVKKTAQKVKPVPGWVGVTGTHGQDLPARVVLLGAADEEAVEVLRVEADHPAIQCTFARGPGARATLRVKIDQSRVVGDVLQGCVRVYLARPAEQVVTVPVSCSLR